MISWCNMDMEGWSPSQPLSDGGGASQINEYAELTYGDKQQFTLKFMPTVIFDSNSWIPQMPVFGLWEEAGDTEDNPHKHVGNMQTPPRKSPKNLSCRLHRI